VSYSPAPPRPYSSCIQANSRRSWVNTIGTEKDDSSRHILALETEEQVRNIFELISTLKSEPKKEFASQIF
jgi:enamine deaminase RidA (YjgF/YER057c/UK114 family)